MFVSKNRQVIRPGSVEFWSTCKCVDDRGHPQDRRLPFLSDRPLFSQTGTYLSNQILTVA